MKEDTRIILKCYNIKYDINDEDCDTNNKSKKELEETLPKTVEFEITDVFNDIFSEELEHQVGGWSVKNYDFEVIKEKELPNPETDLTRFIGQ